SLAAEFVPDAVNVSGCRVGEQVAGWLDLARTLGLACGRLLGAASVAIEITACGQLSTEVVADLCLSAVRGLLSGVTSEAVTFVNAMSIAESRGVDVKLSTKDEAKGHNSTVRVKTISAEGENSVLEGALTGIDGVEKIVRIDGRGVDMRATGRNLFFSYSDRPGALGIVGSVLGNAGINIKAAALTQGKQDDAEV